MYHVDWSQDVDFLVTPVNIVPCVCGGCGVGWGWIWVEEGFKLHTHNCLKILPKIGVLCEENIVQNG